MTDDQLTVLAERFCAASLPYSVRADLCATEHGPRRTGTHLLTVTQAREVLRQVIGEDVVIFRADVSAEDFHRLTGHTVIDLDAATLRDTFAGQAMQAYVGSRRWRRHAGEMAIRLSVSPESIVANTAYEQADAMLAARKRTVDAK